MEVVLHVNYKRSPEKYEDNSGTEKTTLKKFRKGNKQTKYPQNEDGLRNKYYPGMLMTFWEEASSFMGKLGKFTGGQIHST